MDTDFLHTLVLVNDLGSMSAAARARGITPAGVAQQIRTLERRLGVVLVTRAGRTVCPTPEGLNIVERARAVLAGVHDLERLARAQAHETELRIGAINTALHGVLPSMLARLAARHPQVRVHLSPGTSDHLYEAVQTGTIDAAVCLHPDFALPKALGWKLLRREPLVVLAPARLAAAEPLKLLREAPFIRYDRTLGGGRQAERYLRAQGITPHERFELGSLISIGMMVERGLGIALVPDVALPALQPLAIARLRLPKQPEARRFGVIWMRACAQQLLVRELASGAGVS